MEMLVRVLDRKGFDAKTNTVSLRPGDVVTVQADGWKWSEKERTNPEWCIVKLPGVHPLLHKDMEQPALDALGGLLLKRARKLDLTAAIFNGKLAAREVTFSTQIEKSAVLATRTVKELAVAVG
jgi:hypothetical protein